MMRNAGLEETQAGIKIAGRNISNLSYADDTTLMAESEEELKSLEVPGSVLKCETVLGTLEATRKVTRLSLKESTEVPGTTSSEPFLSS